MIESIENVGSLLRMSGSSNSEDLQMLLDHDVPITGMQANLMFLNRGYGKTFMSYCFAYIQLLKKGEINLEQIAGMKDPDVGTQHSRIRNWQHGFLSFLQDHTDSHFKREHYIVRLIKTDSRNSSSADSEEHH